MSILVCKVDSSDEAYVVARGDAAKPGPEKGNSHDEGVFGRFFHRGGGEDSDAANPDEAMTEEATEDIEEATEEATEAVSVNEPLSFNGIPEGVVKGAGLGLIFAVIVAAVAAVIYRKMKEGKTTPKAPGMPMELTLYSGRCLTNPQGMELRDGLLLGSSNKCDVRFEGEGVEPEHARIVIQNGQPYIEDLGSVNGVTIGGMRIQDRNPIRSGYVIGLGEVEFLLKY